MTTTIDPRLLREGEVRPIIEWDPSTSAAAERTADSGDLSSAADLCEHIMADDRVTGCLLQRTSVVRLPLDFSQGDKRFIKSLGEEGDFWRIQPASELKQLHAWYATLGVALGRLCWVDEGGGILRRDRHYVPQIICWSPRNLSHEFATGKWWTYVGMNAQREQVTPGQNGWLLWICAASRPWAKAAWRAIRAWCLLKDYARIDLSRFSERLGQGVWNVKVPNGLVDTKAKRTALARELKEIGSRGSFVTGVDWSTELIESQARNFELFRMQVDLANLGIAVALLGQNLTTEVSSGAYASAQVHKSVAGEIIQSDTESLSDFQHDQILSPIAVAEYGTPDAAPYPEYDATPPVDREGTVKTWQGFGAFLKDARDTGIDQYLDVREAGDRAGIPWRADLPEGPLELKEAPAPPVAPVVPAQPAAPNPVPPPPKTKQQTGLAIQLASGDDPSVAQGMVDGQLYTDRVVSSLSTEMARAIRPALDEVLAIVAQADDSGQLYDQLIEAFGERMSARELGELIQGAMLMVGAAGVGSVQVDAGIAPKA